MDIRGDLRAKVRKPRAARSCELCRAKKTKCDEGSPCSYCKNHNTECIYRTADKPRRMVYSTDYVRQLERQVQTLSGQQSLANEPGLESPSPSHDGLPARFQSEYLINSTSRPMSAQIGEQNNSLDALASIASRQSHNATAAKEVSAVNQHTNNAEFYGSSSSMSLLSRIRDKEINSPQTQHLERNEASLVSELHNPAFFASPPGVNNRAEPPPLKDQTHQNQYRTFINNFFSTIHYIHPILEKASFLVRCEDLWAGGRSTPPRSFMALYYSLVSLGALVGPRDEESSGAMSNVEWSRNFFDKARALCSELSMTTDLEMVQCFFFMAKICQNELNPHLSYMYTGLAVRTALAMGINREPPPDTKKTSTVLKAESRTWWGLYSLETEMSFSMGRPDTLGVDLYHNRKLPVIGNSMSLFLHDYPEMVEPPQCEIIKCMVDFSRIVRTVCLRIYLSESPPHMSLAHGIEQDLDNWLDELPASIRPSRTYENGRSLKSVKDAQWMKRQRLVLFIRYHNVRMLLFASFITATASIEQSTSMYQENISKGLESAKQTIEIIYETYRHHDFFRTWYYNTTYTLFAVSILLVYIVQEASEAEKSSLFGYVEMAIEILETMDDCVVAKKAAKMIQRALSRAKDSNSAGSMRSVERSQEVDTVMQDPMTATFNHYWGPLNLMDGEIDIAFPFGLNDLEETW